MTIRVSVRPGIDAWRGKITVTDTGTGLTEKEIGGLFRDFARIETRERSDAGGTGLGLVISRGFAQLMDGNITVASQPGEGAVFTFDFVMGAIARAESFPAPEAAAAMLPNQGLRGVRSILLVDDNASNRYVVRAFLKRLEVTMVEAENGQVALDRLRERSFDLVLLDMHMPVMDGQTTFRTMRESEGEMARVPVIALTADAADEDRARYLSMGMSGYLPKPIDKPTLLTEIQRVMEQHSIAA